MTKLPPPDEWAADEIFYERVAAFGRARGYCNEFIVAQTDRLLDLLRRLNGYEFAAPPTVTWCPGIGLEGADREILGVAVDALLARQSEIIADRIGAAFWRSALEIAFAPSPPRPPPIGAGGVD